MAKLEKYRKMRDFSATPEPSGKRGGSKKKKRPIFVVQKHQASRLHYDFRLEMEGVLKSWAIPKGPSYDPSIRRLAMMTEDHPYDYASFEGVIPEGNYGAGNVIIWDQGTWQFLDPGDDPLAALNQGKLTFRLEGKKLHGEWALVRMHGRSERGNEWLLLKHRDEFADAAFDVTRKAPRSVVSSRTVEEVDSRRTWKSNREPGTNKPRTVADVLREKKRRTGGTKSGAGSSDVSKSPGRKGESRGKSRKARAKAHSKGSSATKKLATSTKRRGRSRRPVRSGG